MTEMAAARLERDWLDNPRWRGIERPYGATEVVRLRGSVAIEHTLARRGAETLWASLHEKDLVNALGALTGNQAMQQVEAGLEAIYVSSWQVAGLITQSEELSAVHGSTEEEQFEEAVVAG